MSYRPNPPSIRDAIIERRLREIESGEWEQKVADYHAGRRPLPPIGGGMPVKDRFALSQGLAPRGESGWDIPDLIEWDFSNLNQAAAGTALGTILPIVPGSNAQVIGSPDSIGPSLAAANGNRQAGTGQNQYATVLSAWLFSRTGAGAIYVPANTPTMQLQVVSAGGAAQGVDNLTAALTLNAGNLPNFWNQMALTVPASRQFTLTGLAPITTAAAVFYGDVLFAALVTSVALNVQGNHLVMTLEMA